MHIIYKRGFDKFFFKYKTYYIKLLHKLVTFLKNIKKMFLLFIFWFRLSGTARTQIPTIKNYALDIPTLGVFARVSLTAVQWQGLTQEEPPS